MKTASSVRWSKMRSGIYILCEIAARLESNELPKVKLGLKRTGKIVRKGM